MPEVDQSKEVKVEKVQEVEMEGKVEEEVSDEWLDVLGSGDLKKKVSDFAVFSSFFKFNFPFFFNLIDLRKLCCERYDIKDELYVWKRFNVT